MEVYDFFTEFKNGEVRSYIVMEFIEKLPENKLSESSAIQVALGLIGPAGSFVHFVAVSFVNLLLPKAYTYS